MYNCDRCTRTSKIVPLNEWCPFCDKDKPMPTDNKTPYLHAGDARLDSLRNAIKEEVYARAADNIPVSAVIGILEMVKLEILEEQKETQEG